MSLTSYLNSPKHQELRNQFKSYFPRPAFHYEMPLLVPPLTKNYGVIGTAYDYLFRFTIEHHNKREKIETAKWIADIAFRGIAGVYCENAEKRKILNDRFQSVKINYGAYIKNGRLNKQILSDLLFLAKLDLFFRIGYVAPDLLQEDEQDIKDLKALYSLINQNDFKVRNKCYLNPTFGKGSMLVGGADADVILDDTLIDIKVTKHLKLERDYLNQILGYYILALIGGINSKPEKKQIKNVGIYFARHGLLWKAPISEFATPKKISEFKNWFLNYFNNMKQFG
ncbi:hypothetical protein [Agriterribacter sp.]|uniref:hypothetical protein n=1 Tax=Agriterribacter sp. TaxID=2821509 RepID=UPI002C1A1B5F|nr:hypothetical protein [Agriterribacter sp.]HRO46959.1 hypothetical protein [Agriterribacter sp.]HRQ18990.1 hypothetical protein [Agriterribacter sp.]